MQKYLLALVAVLYLCACSTLASAKESPRVIATVKPIHSLVAAVMQGSGEPRLLIPSGASPHTYQLKPSDARALQDAEIIFWVGEDLEKFLEKSLTSLPKNARVIKLAAAPGVTLRNSRESGAWEARIDPNRGYVANDGNAPEDHAIEHRGSDMHIWLDVDNARAIVRAAADALMSADPERAELYRDNRERAEERLVKLDQALRSELTPVAGRPYIVFHDAYRYLEHRYGLTPVGAITVKSGTAAERSATRRDPQDTHWHERHLHF